MFAKASTVLLAAPAFAAALPLVPGLGATAKADLQVFANAFVSATTGGLFSTSDSVTGLLGLNLNLGLSLNTALSANVNSWALQRCNNRYHNPTLCGEVSAYLAATLYATQRGWTAVELFAALGVDRVNHWHDTLGNVCGSSSCPAHTCDPIWGRWDGWYNSFTTISADIYVSEALELKTKGFLTLIDAALAATAKAKVDVKADVDVKAKADVKTNAGINANIGLNANVDVNAKAGAAAVVHRGLPVVPDVLAIAKADAALHAVTDLDLLHHGAAKTVVDASGHVLGGAVIGRGLDAFAVGEGAAKVGHLVSGSGSGLALVDKEGVITAGEGDLKVAGIKVAGQGHAIVY